MRASYPFWTRYCRSSGEIVSRPALLTPSICRDLVVIVSSVLYSSWELLHEHERYSHPAGPEQRTCGMWVCYIADNHIIEFSPSGLLGCLHQPETSAKNTSTHGLRATRVHCSLLRFLPLQSELFPTLDSPYLRHLLSNPYRLEQPAAL